MKIHQKAIVTAGLILIVLAEANASYCAVGKIKGQVCKGFVIEICEVVSVDAVKDDKGKLYTVKKCYSDVSQYDERNGRCWIDTKSRGGGIFSWGLNAALQPNFLHRNEKGGYEEIDVEYLVFKCVRK